MTRYERILRRSSVLFVMGISACFLFFWIAPYQHEERVDIQGKHWIVTRAFTPELRLRGLSFRDSLPFGQGMLFLFPDMDPQPYAFWMRGMRFPLDIVWIRAGRVVFIERNVPADSQDIFRPPEDADMVLEVNVGELDGVSIGDAVRIP